MATTDPELHGRLAALVVGADVAPEPTSATSRRILEVAHARFGSQGIERTTMSQIAADAGISREWLYRHHSNREAVLEGVIGWRLGVLVDELTRSTLDHDDPVEGLVDAVVHTVTFARDDALFSQLLVERGIRTEATDTRLDFVVERGIATSAATLTLLGGTSPERARLIGETLGRVTLSLLIAPGALRDDDYLRDYLGSLVRALLR